MKTLEYLAAGIPVVATDLPAIRWLNCPDIRVAAGAKAYAESVLEVLAQDDAGGIGSHVLPFGITRWKCDAFREGTGSFLH